MPIERVDIGDLSEDISDELHRILLGLSPEIQGAAIAELFARLLAGWAPPMRAEMRAMTFELVDDLVPIIIGQLREDGQYPAEWAALDAKGLQ